MAAETMHSAYQKLDSLFDYGDHMLRGFYLHRPSVRMAGAGKAMALNHTLFNFGPYQQSLNGPVFLQPQQR